MLTYTLVTASAPTASTSSDMIAADSSVEADADENNWTPVFIPPTASVIANPTAPTVIPNADGVEVTAVLDDSNGIDVTTS
jgi:hypothetical protein